MRFLPLTLSRAVLLALACVLVGCLSYPDSNERVYDRIVVTRFKEGTDFGAYKTFSISPEVIVFKQSGSKIEREPLDEGLAARLVDDTIAHLSDRGYTQVEQDDDPDLGVAISILNGEVTGYYSGYWCSYWGYPYASCYYPWYTSYTYNTGTVITDVLDLKTSPPTDPDAPPPDPSDPVQQIDLLWTGAVYGVLKSNVSANLEDALDGIAQSFAQSPYFKTE